MFRDLEIIITEKLF